MDKIYSILKSKSNLVSVSLLCCSVLSALITLERPDYNLYLFLFICFSMFFKKSSSPSNAKLLIFERQLCLIVITFSLLIDIIWINTHKEIIGSFFIFLSWIEFIIKIIVCGIVAIMWLGLKKEGLSSELEGTAFKELHEESP